MIKCDYDQCEGWYHLECVGFKDKTEEEITKIKWYCSDACKEVFKFICDSLLYSSFVEIESESSSGVELQTNQEKGEKIIL